MDLRVHGDHRGDRGLDAAPHRYGREIFAVGGNIEAARRAGINVNWIRISVFALCSTLAAVSGIIAAMRLGFANQQSGGGETLINAIAAAVIGGTSLFGGRTRRFAPLLGALVIGYHRQRFGIAQSFL